MADFNPERNAEIIRLRRDGAGPREIARKLGVSPGVVAGVLHRHDLTVEPRGRGFGRLDDHAIATIRALRADGAKVAAIAAQFDITPASVSHIALGTNFWRDRAA